MYGENNRSGNSRFGSRPMGGNFGGNSTPPVNVGDELTVTIEAIGEKGDGVAKQNGFVLFVPGVKQGENVKIKVTRVLRKVGFAEVVGRGEAPAEGSVKEQPAEEESYSEENDSESFGEESETKDASDDSEEF